MSRFLCALILVLAGPPALAEESLPAPLPEPEAGLVAATFAGGCFWCVEEAFDKVDGVERTISGYTGGDEKNPTYRQVSRGTTGHTEAVRVVFDPARVDYEKLLSVFWHNIDPTVKNRQFCDTGSQYRSAIFHHSEEQRRLAQRSRERIAESGVLPAPIVTPIQPAQAFWPAEGYHQDYYEKNPLRYKFYVNACGRYDRLEELWGEQARES
ncbi:MAG: peptide-methionine (S)-S-oxide reductase MsrA [Halofilum sp. (in: g-proteobacteria)]|nr:peptide-methionine (S)-S-oxide reductase MsrA [Halofilum sp. (in: g-proteobacteria)]